MKPISSMKAPAWLSPIISPACLTRAGSRGPCRQLPGRGTSPEKLPAGGGHRAMRPCRGNECGLIADAVEVVVDAQVQLVAHAVAPHPHAIARRSCSAERPWVQRTEAKPALLRLRPSLRRQHDRADRGAAGWPMRPHDDVVDRRPAEQPVREAKSNKMRCIWRLCRGTRGGNRDRCRVALRRRLKASLRPPRRPLCGVWWRRQDVHATWRRAALAQPSRRTDQGTTLGYKEYRGGYIADRGRDAGRARQRVSQCAPTGFLPRAPVR